MSSRVDLALEPELYRIGASAAENRHFAGSALLVRTDGAAHVFRGAGPLDGLDETDLR